MQTRFQPEAGFTLVELMVVVLIIGILVTLAVPIYAATQASATRKTCFSNQREIEGAAQTYLASKGTMPTPGTVDSGHPLITGGYIKSAPYCPASTDGSAGNYGLNDAGTIDTFPSGCSHGHY
jgi:prepilin-type N-terminal cleavage/methylation domain-containing protein